MKRIINSLKVVSLALCISALSVMSANAAAGSYTFILQPTAVSNILGAPLLVKKVIITAPASSNVSVLAYDAPALITTYSNIAYSTVTQYATNWISSWTNFYGVVNSVTNISLAAVTNTVPATTNNYPIKFTAASAAGTMSTIDDASFFFLNGLLFTNTSLSGIATITVEYAK